MNGWVIGGAIADLLIAVCTLAALLLQGRSAAVSRGRMAQKVDDLTAEVQRLRDWKHDEVGSALNALERSLAVHDERLDEHDEAIGYLRRRASGR